MYMYLLRFMKSGWYDNKKKLIFITIFAPYHGTIQNNRFHKFIHCDGAFKIQKSESIWVELHVSFCNIKGIADTCTHFKAKV